jgi:hypothetical protein
MGLEYSPPHKFHISASPFKCGRCIVLAMQLLLLFPCLLSQLLHYPRTPKSKKIDLGVLALSNSTAFDYDDDSATSVAREENKKYFL